MFEEWFFSVKRWEDFDLVDGALRWVCMSGVPIPLWYKQFFAFAVAEFRLFLGILPATDQKANLKEAWIKVHCKPEFEIPQVMDVQLPLSWYLVRLEVFSPEDAPFWLVSSLSSPSDESSVGSSCSCPLENVIANLDRSIDCGWLALDRSPLISLTESEGGVTIPQLDDANLKSHGVVVPSEHTTAVLNVRSTLAEVDFLDALANFSLSLGAIGACSFNLNSADFCHIDDIAFLENDHASLM